MIAWPASCRATEPEALERVLFDTMNRPTTHDHAVTPADLRGLNGRIVLVKSTRDRRNPPTGMRGWIEVHETPDNEPEVRIAIEFPQMFSFPAHRRTITLDQAGLERLLASEYNGAFEFTIDDELV